MPGSRAFTNQQLSDRLQKIIRKLNAILAIQLFVDRDGLCVPTILAAEELIDRAIQHTVEYQARDLIPDAAMHWNMRHAASISKDGVWEVISRARADQVSVIPYDNHATFAIQYLTSLYHKLTDQSRALVTMVCHRGCFFPSEMEHKMYASFSSELAFPSNCHMHNMAISVAIAIGLAEDLGLHGEGKKIFRSLFEQIAQAIQNSILPVATISSSCYCVKSPAIPPPIKRNESDAI